MKTRSIFDCVTLHFIKGYGVNRLASLISYTGGIETILSGKGYPVKCGQHCLKLPSQKQIDEARLKAEQEMIFIEKHDVNVHFFLDETYPNRLKSCYGAPVVLFGKGKYDLNKHRTISIVGTRNATQYGLAFCEHLIASLQAYDVSVISGMAYGIDVCAHRACLDYNIPTLAVLAHGLDRLYPNAHKKTARAMVENGGLLTEYPINTNPDRERFPARNRIVAGMSDATIVIESGFKGGSLITADMAFNFNRDVLALPGNVGQTFSQGCNRLIKEQKASMITEIDDLIHLMGWDLEQKKKGEVQKSMFLNLSDIEKEVVYFIDSKGFVTIDEIMIYMEQPTSKIATLLLQLEMKGVIFQQPGKKFKLAN